MRSVLASLALCLAACGGSSAAHDLGVDFAASMCPADITSVDDGAPCGYRDVQCSQCTPTCAGPCSELFCENGSWIHVLEYAICDGGVSDGGPSDGG